MTSTLFEAIAFAAKAHKGQNRKGSRVPYIHHPLEVGKTLLIHDFPDEVVIAGYLHDTLEDTPVTAEEIRKKFGDRVAVLVEGASEPADLVKGNYDSAKKAPWEIRKQHTIHYLGSDAPDEVVAISCADKLSNLRDMKRDFDLQGEELWKRFNAPKEKQSWYFQSLHDVFKKRLGGRANSPLYEEFRGVYESLFKTGK